MSHARVMPSQLHLTVPCPGSLQLQEKVPPTPETEEQAEGTAGHLVALKHASKNGADWGLGRKFSIGKHEFEVDDDMLDGALMYADEALYHTTARYEDPVSIPDVHPTECFGTPDYWRHMHINEGIELLLKVIDYKYGHRYVEVYEHYQLIAYAAGVARRLQLPLDFKVMLVIVQPRSYSAKSPVREWTTTVKEIFQYCRDVIAPRVELALGENPPTQTGRHCLDCRARHACKTLQRETAHVVDFSGTAEVDDPSYKAVGQELRILKEAIKRLEARYTGLYEQANNLARSGYRIGFWSLEPSKGKLQWMQNTTVDEVGSLGDLVGINTRKPAALLTPTQVIKAGIDEGIVMQYAHRPPGAMRLVQDDMTALRKIFGAKQI